MYASQVVVVPRDYVAQLERVARAAERAAEKLKVEYDRLASDDPPKDENWREGESVWDELYELEVVRQASEMHIRSLGNPLISDEVMDEITRRVLDQLGPLNISGLSAVQAGLVETAVLIYGMTPTEWLEPWLAKYKSEGR